MYHICLCLALMPKISLAFSSASSPSPSPSQPQRAKIGLPVTAADLQTREPSNRPYDITAEEAPAHPFFSSTFQENLELGRQLASDAADTIRRISHQYRDQPLDQLLSDAETPSAFQPSAAKTVAILGDSGEGMSDILPQLL